MAQGFALDRGVDRDSVVTDLGNIGGTHALSSDTMYEAVLTDNLVITLPSPVDGKLCNIMFQFTMGVAYTVTVPANVDWNGTISPTLYTTRRNRMMFDTIDGGTNWNGYFSSF